MTTARDAIREGREALERRAWGEAYARLAEAGATGGLDADDLERLAVAATMSGHDEESTQAWEQAHRIHLERGDPSAALRAAFWLAFGLFLRGEPARGGGWLSRASELVEEHHLDCAECGYLLLPPAMERMGAGDPAGAYRLSEQAGDWAARFGEADLAALSRLGRGQARLAQGRVAEALALLDGAMLVVTEGRVSPVVTGVVYCAVILGCQEVHDVRRAQEWTEALTRWCDTQTGLVPYRGQCLVHRAQLHRLHGDWAGAEVEAEAACVRLAHPAHAALGLATYERAELHRLRGELDEAEAGYGRAHELGHPPQPGLALLLAARGRTEAAAAVVDSALSATAGPVARAQLLPAAVEVLLAAGQVETARAAADELATVAAALGSPVLGAASSQWLGAVLLAEGEARRALRPLREACRAWQELGVPYEVARTRVTAGRACLALGDRQTAELELGAARRAFEALGARTDLAALDAGSPRSGEAPVTRREVDVLRLVARGRTNREIAGELVISEKTVERHLSNIFTKLGVSNRAAATAEAYARDLV